MDLVNDTSRRSLRHDQAFGYDEPIAAWGFETFIQHLHPEDRADVERRFGEAVKQQHDWHFECRVIWPDSSVHWIEAHGSIYRTLKGKATHMLGIVSNITERKRTEEERNQLLVSEQAARAQAESANRVRDEFLATISHELRTPLNAILGWAHMLVRGKLDEKSTTHGLEVIERNARAQNQLIADLLDVSRIITGKFRFEQAAVELIPVIEAALETVRPAAEAKGVELRVLVDPAAGLISGDANRLQQVVWNLLTNALKYTPKMGALRCS